MIEKKQLIPTILITVLATALCMLILLGRYEHTNIAALQQRISLVQSDEQRIESHYKTEEQKLQKSNDSLQQLVDVHLQELAQARETAGTLENELHTLSLKVQSAPDTIRQKIPGLDSLALKSLLFMQVADKRDSICDTTVDELNIALNNSEDADSLCNDSYRAMKMTLDTSLRQQQDMAVTVKKLDKKLERKTAENKLLAIGMLILSGMTAVLLLVNKG